MAAQDGIQLRRRDRRPVGLVRWTFQGQRAVWLLFAMVLAADVMLIGLHGAAEIRGSRNQLYYLDTDRGYAEFFQYVKFTFLCALVALYALEQRSWQIAAWLPLFGYFLVDDAMRIHENVGGWFVRELELTAAYGLRAQDFGEVLISAIAGAIAGIPLVLGYVLGSRTVRWVYRVFLFLVAILLFFGILVDLVHIMVSAWIPEFDWVAVFEDGGEMIAVSLMIVFALRLNVSGGSPGLLLAEPPATLPGIIPGRQVPTDGRGSAPRL